MAKVSASKTPRELVVNIGGMSTAGSQQVTKVDTSAPVTSLFAMQVHYIEYYITSQSTNALMALLAQADSISFGFSWLATQPVNGFIPSSAGIVDFNNITRYDYDPMVAAGGQLIVDPFIKKDMHARHPDGVLVHPANLYWWYYVLNAVAGVWSLTAKIYYTETTITQNDWDDMWKQMVISAF